MGQWNLDLLMVSHEGRWREQGESNISISMIHQIISINSKATMSKISKVIFRFISRIKIHNNYQVDFFILFIQAYEIHKFHVFRISIYYFINFCELNNLFSRNKLSFIKKQISEIHLEKLLYGGRE